MKPVHLLVRLESLLEAVKETRSFSDHASNTVLEAMRVVKTLIPPTDEAPPQLPAEATVTVYQMRQTASVVWPDEMKRKILAWADALETSEQTARNLAGTVDGLRATERGLTAGILDRDRTIDTANARITELTAQLEQRRARADVDWEELGWTIRDLSEECQDDNDGWRSVAKAVIAAYESARPREEVDQRAIANILYDSNLLSELCSNALAGKIADMLSGKTVLHPEIEATDAH